MIIDKTRFLTGITVALVIVLSFLLAENSGSELKQKKPIMKKVDGTLLMLI